MMKAHIAEEKGMNNESRIVRVETVIEHIHYMLDRMDKRFDKIDERLIEVQKETKEGLLRNDSKIDLNFKWVVGTMITLFILNGALPIITKMISTFITT